MSNNHYLQITQMFVGLRLYRSALKIPAQEYRLGEFKILVSCVSVFLRTTIFWNYIYISRK